MEYSIFTEHDCREESKNKNKADLNALEEKLKQSDIHKKQRSPNSIVINYNGNIDELKQKVIDAASQIKRQSPMPIFVAHNSEDMYSYK